jgi:acyl-phosphate glycerol 3-phosphate acyltransferase
MDWMMVLRGAAAAGIGYLIGCISFGYISAKIFRGKDIREVGSGNAGTANVIRNYGWAVGLVTFAGDVAKGASAALIGGLLLQQASAGGVSLLGMAAQQGVSIGAYIGGLAAVLGHIWPVFLKFRGGKGVAASFGVFLVIMPWQALIAFALCAAIIAVTRFVSLGSLIGTALMVACSAVFFFGDWWHHIASAILFLLVWYSHRANLKRLAEGRENTI